VQRWEQAATGWRRALQGPAWDGEWFQRAFFDDGTPLGSHANAECRIDLIAQAWSVLSAAATPQQQHAAMASAERLLVDEEHGLVRLLDPPLANAEPSAGYIQAYPAGVRENGGQYSHGAVWYLMAQASLGDAEGAYQTFTRLSPAHRSAHPRQGAAYQIEPYVMAGDVYTHAPYTGRGGWSWYTGSAAWMHRAALESICGLQLRAGSVRFTPQLPNTWPQITLTLRHGGRVHRFIVCAPWAAADIGRALASGARVLHVGEWLQLEEAGEASRHLVVATTKAGRHAGHGDETPQTDAAPSYSTLRHAPMPATGGQI
jgi:cyclic beta-1,2-glucan synthetase